jgi:hypothetical protein
LVLRYHQNNLKTTQFLSLWTVFKNSEIDENATENRIWFYLQVKKVGTGCCVEQLDGGWRPEHKWKCDVSYRLNTAHEDKAGCNVNNIAPQKLESKPVFVTI